ncbi:hypothetical protein [Spiroplasma endosymbiont of Megaselia nigra]|uniref:hypothetical protein n=1 Tax=Spiroplasma endosymbiont of Megaselia nigra TaxID=2478537 RepID=UPI000F86E428|nr:hypothetical protein [Spiroplasma endosymbiont of Megaselia nigra]RUO86148.1 hypothetical protein D9R21_04800 [Spiroplasma endosymbiont of Megaselia nigra]
MKKLLSLLSALTISGAAIPTTIAASPYQKENLIRKKRDNWYGWIYINFYGISDILKGTLSLDTTNKKIRLGGLGDYRVVHSNEVNQVYNKIIIKNNNGDVIKEILYWKDISIQIKFEIENLLNGIPYNNDYTI